MKKSNWPQYTLERSVRRACHFLWGQGYAVTPEMVERLVAFRRLRNLSDAEKRYILAYLQKPFVGFH